MSEIDQSTLRSEQTPEGSRSLSCLPTIDHNLQRSLVEAKKSLQYIPLNMLLFVLLLHN